MYRDEAPTYAEWLRRAKDSLAQLRADPLRNDPVDHFREEPGSAQAPVELKKMRYKLKLGSSKGRAVT